MKRIYLSFFLLGFLGIAQLKAQFHDARPVKVIKEVELATKKEKLEKEIVLPKPTPKPTPREKINIKEPEQIPVAMPLEKLQQTSGFGWRKHPIFKDWRKHKGVDFASNKDTVFAVLNGKIIEDGNSPSLGYYLKIQHGENLETLYAHLSEYYYKTGQEVKAGESIALTGSTGWSTSDHLHLGVYQNGTAIDPIQFFTNVLNFNNKMKEKQIKSAALEKLKLIAQNENPVSLNKEEERFLQIEAWDQENILEESEEEDE